MTALVDVIKTVLSALIAKFFLVGRNVWLFSERGDDARDNGYWMFKYLRENHSNIKAYYCITPDSVDKSKVAGLGTIKYGSLIHGILYFSARVRLSSHAYLCSPGWHGIGRISKIRWLAPRGKSVFLQHGIIKDMIPGITARNFSPDIFICGAKPEYDFVLKNFGFPSDVVAYTGLARYDNLDQANQARKNKRRILLIMPTWRSSLRGASRDEFRLSRYFKEYMRLLNSATLKNFCDKYGVTVIFYPHYEFQKWISLFSSDNPHVIIASLRDYDVQSLLIKCDVLVTDYSSVFFDVAYQLKPIVYFQFDYSEYRQTQYQEGYFHYDKSFGPVAKTVSDVLKNLTRIMDDDQPRVYNAREREFFKLRDHNNRRRIYNVVTKKLEGRKK